MILHPGFKLNNKYNIIERLGSPGAFGAVFRAVEELSGLEVAIKEFFISANPEEMKVLAKLRHPNIIRYITYEAYNNTQFMVMEYASSGNLEDIIAQKGKLTENEALSILSQITEALIYAHSLNIVHRDIKPLNIFCLGADVYKLGDFGIARLLEKGQSRTAGRGSIYYSAPELFEGKFSKKTDVYALGVTFYEMLTGKPLYTGTEMELMRKIIDPSVLPEVPVGVSRMTQSILEGCLEKELEKRWDLAKLLESIDQRQGGSESKKSNNSGNHAFQRGSQAAAVAQGQAQATVGRMPVTKNVYPLLCVVTGSYAGQMIPVDEKGIIIGRDPQSCNLIIPSELISRRHCIVKYDVAQNCFTLTDTRSSNGTFRASGVRVGNGQAIILRSGEQFFLAVKDNMFEVKL